MRGREGEREREREREMEGESACVHVITHATAHVWSSVNETLELIFAFHVYMVSAAGIQIEKLFQSLRTFPSSYCFVFQEFIPSLNEQIFLEFC